MQHLFFFPLLLCCCCCSCTAGTVQLCAALRKEGTHANEDLLLRLLEHADRFAAAVQQQQQQQLQTARFMLLPASLLVPSYLLLMQQLLLLLPRQATRRGVRLLFEPPFLGRSLMLPAAAATAATVRGGGAGTARVLDSGFWLLEVFAAALLLHKENIAAAKADELFVSLFAAAAGSWRRHKEGFPGLRTRMQRQQQTVTSLPAAAALLLQLLRCYAGETLREYWGPLLQQSSQQQCLLSIWKGNLCTATVAAATSAAATATGAAAAGAAARAADNPLQVPLDPRCLGEGHLHAFLAAAAYTAQGPRSLAAALLLLSASCGDPAATATAAAAAHQLSFRGDEETAKHLKTLLDCSRQEAPLSQELQLHYIDGLLLLKPVLLSHLPVAAFFDGPPLLRVAAVPAAAAQAADTDAAATAAAATTELPLLQLQPLACGTAALAALQQRPALLQCIYSFHYDSSVHLVGALAAAGDRAAAAATAAATEAPHGAPFSIIPPFNLTAPAPAAGSSSSRSSSRGSFMHLQWMEEACCFLTSLKLAAAVLPLHAWVLPSHWSVCAASTEVWGPGRPCSLGCASWFAFLCLIKAAKEALQREQQQQQQRQEGPQPSPERSKAAATAATAATATTSATAAADDWCGSNEQAGEQQEVFWLLLLDTLHFLQRNGWPCPPCCSKAYGSSNRSNSSNSSNRCSFEAWLLLLQQGGSSSWDWDLRQLVKSFVGESSAAAAADGAAPKPKAHLPPSLTVLSKLQLQQLLLPLLRLLAEAKYLSLPLTLPSGLQQQQQQQKQQRSAFKNTAISDPWGFANDSFTSSSTIESVAAANQQLQQQQDVSAHYGRQDPTAAEDAAAAAAAAALSLLPSQFLVLRWLLQSVVLFSFAPIESSSNSKQQQQQQGQAKEQQGLEGTVAVLALLHEFTIGSSSSSSNSSSSTTCSNSGNCSSSTRSIMEQHVQQLLPLCELQQIHRLLPLALCLFSLHQIETKCSSTTANNTAATSRMLQVIDAASLLLASDCLLALLQPVSHLTLNPKP